MGFLDKAKQAAEQAATKAREGVEDVQAKRELVQAYNELGKTAFELIDGGELSDPRLDEDGLERRDVGGGRGHTARREPAPGDAGLNRRFSRLGLTRDRCDDLDGGRLRRGSHRCASPAGDRRAREARRP